MKKLSDLWTGPEFQSPIEKRLLDIHQRETFIHDPAIQGQEHVFKGTIGVEGDHKGHLADQDLETAKANYDPHRDDEYWPDYPDMDEVEESVNEEFLVEGPTDKWMIPLFDAIEKNKDKPEFMRFINQYQAWMETYDRAHTKLMKTKGIEGNLARGILGAAGINEEVNESEAYYQMKAAERLAAKDGHDFHKLPEYSSTHDKHKEYYRDKAKNESSKNESVDQMKLDGRRKEFKEKLKNLFYSKMKKEDAKDTTDIMNKIVDRLSKD
jgi:hypothetical protein